MATLTLRTLFADYAKGRRDFRGTTITPEDEWSIPPLSDLSALVLTDAKLDGIEFKGADLRESDFFRASLVDADLSEAVLIGARLSDADLTDATFRRADLTRALAENATFRGAVFRDSILHSASLSNASFRNADLSGADLRFADFSKADLNLANLTDCRADGARFDKATLIGSDVTGMSLVGASLESAHLSGLAWLNSDLAGADLNSARLDGASFRNCRLLNVRARHALLSDSLVVNSDLTGIDLTQARMNRCLWQDVTLDGAELEGADLKDAVLSPSSGRLPAFSQPKIEEPLFIGTKMFKEMPANNVSVVRVFYATDRKQDADGFGPDRDDRLRYGVCDVSIPRDHRMGELEAPSIWRLEVNWDAKRHVMVTAISERSPAHFFAQLRHRAKASKRRQALVFVHGYNVAFDGALRRAGQLAYDLAFDGPTIAYSWASRADATLYAHDEATIEDTIPRLEGFIRQIGREAEVERLHIIAHSMGNRALVRALQQLSAGSERPFFVDHVILTAPDIDAGVFKGIATRMCAAAEQVTMYASSNDLAIQLSKKFHGYRRAGEGGRHITILDGVSTIDASELETDLLGHSYFAEHRSVISDIFYLLQDLPPESRFGLVREFQGREREYWRFRSEGRKSLLSRLWAWWRRRAEIKNMLSTSS